MRTGLVSLIILGGAFWLFFWEMRVAGETVAEARTAVINVIVMVEIAYLFACRSLNHSLLRIGLLSTPWAIAGALLMIGAQLLFTYAPFMNQLFHTAPISAGSWLRIAAVSLGALVVVEFEKWVRYGRGKGEQAVPE